jgi:Cu(I)/Ag(I) efflux system membrane protein CusA/SilA
MQIGTEFMPPLDEGSIMYMPMTVPDVSEERALDLLLRTNKIFEQFPEVDTVVGKAGRAETATDPAPLAMIETFIMLKPKSEWRPGMTKQKLISEMNREIRIPNLWNGFTQPIIGRIEMLSTGLKGDVGIKIYGDDPVRLEELAIQVERLMGQVPGAMGVVAVRTSGLRYLNIDLQEELLATYGVDKGEALSTIAAGIGGSMVTTTIDGRERYGIEVRISQQFRQNIDDVKSLMLMGKDGSQVVLASIADITLEEGPAVIASENGIMRSAVQMNVEGIDLVSFVEQSKEHLADNLSLPPGYFIERAGQYNNQLRAKQTLLIVVPIVIVLILFILYLTYKDL